MHRKVNFSRFINHISAARKPSPIREATALALGNPNILSLASGMPNSAMFPFQSALITNSDGTQIHFSGKNMQQALQYAPTQGIKKLLDWTKKLQIKYHNPPLLSCSEDEFDICITCGSQDGLSNIFQMLALQGDIILLDNPCYAGTISMLRPHGYNLLPVETDKYGMRSDSLLEVMQRWKPEDALNPHSNIPKILYTIPSGGNPTGATATIERKKEIYEIAQKYDILIIEDDPYFYLQFEDLVPSYQSMDVDGRVLRCDSMSKVMSSGLRIGWVSGASPFIKRLILHQQTSVMHASSFGQAMVAALFDQWGLDGFEAHTKEVQKFYKKQRDVMLQCLNKHLEGLAEWNEPQAGMFLWVKLKGITDTAALMRKLMENDILILPGFVFQVLENQKSSFCRLSYSTANEETMDEALKRLAEVLREERQ